MDRKTVRTAKVALGAATCAMLCFTVVGLSLLSESRSRLVRRSLLEASGGVVTRPPAPPGATRSLSELGATPGVTQDVLFFNRVPKAGSEMLVLLITWLQGRNGFRHYRLPGGRKGDDRRLPALIQEEIVENINEFRKGSALPTSFDRHIYFTNFTTFGYQNPTYINLIRDPVDKMMSRFFYADPKRRKEAKLFEQCVLTGAAACNLVKGQLYDLTIPYFCGHEAYCSEMQNKEALMRAKSNVERHFKVVGVLENLNETLAVLEAQIPRYFLGLQDLYFNELLKPHYNKNKNNPRKLRNSVRKKLERSLHMEYDFYYFIKNRLMWQFNSIRR